jgi:hypothetical protein
MKKVLVLSACLWALAGPAQAQAGPPDIVVVRVRDYRTSAAIFTTRGEGKTEKQEFKGEGLSFDKGMIAVNEGYYKVLTQLYQEGYVLQNSSGASGESGGGVITYLFVKNH